MKHSSLFDLYQEVVSSTKVAKMSLDDIEKYSDEIYQMFLQSYAKIGGFPGMNSLKDVLNTSEFPTMLGMEVDHDGDPDIASIQKERTKFGIKLIGGATDGTQVAKSNFIATRVSMLNKTGYYSEMSEPISSIMLKRGVPVVDDEELVRRILHPKDITWLNDGGKYQRVIAGKLHTKMIFGKPLTR